MESAELPKKAMAIQLSFQLYSDSWGISYVVDLSQALDVSYGLFSWEWDEGIESFVLVVKTPTRELKAQHGDWIIKEMVGSSFFRLSVYKTFEVVEV